MQSEKLKKLLKILVKDSIGDLFKYNSFFMLICFLILLDKVVGKIAPKRGEGFSLTKYSGDIFHAGNYIFYELPQKILELLHDHRFFIVVSSLFLFKQLTSLWPSSDMRLMHRNERGGFGIFMALFSLKWKKIAWDTFAVLTLVSFAITWGVISFTAGKILWNFNKDLTALIVFAIFLSPIIPLTMAGLSYSSKIAVIDQGSFVEKLSLFSKLFTNFKIFWQSLLFYMIRSALEIAFVGIIPIFILIAMDIAWLRIILALLIATPVYSFLKMASFKFFLFVYQDYELIRVEYREYYEKISI